MRLTVAMLLKYKNGNLVNNLKKWKINILFYLAKKPRLDSAGED